MVDISALMGVLPVSALEPDWVAWLGGFIDVPKDRGWQERIGLLEPPAGQRVPYIKQWMRWKSCCAAKVSHRRMQRHGRLKL